MKEIKKLIRHKLIFQKYLQLILKNRKQAFKMTILIKFCYFQIVIIAKTTNEKAVQHL